MYRTTVMCLIAAIGFHLQAQTIALKGKVTDKKSGKAISGAVVTLKSKNLTATTNASGEYSLTGVVSVAENSRILPGGQVISLMKGGVAVRLTKEAPVCVELFDMRGNLLERFFNRSATAGEYRFDMMKHPFATNIMVIRVSIGQHTSTFRYLPLTKGTQTYRCATASTNWQQTAKLEAAIDTLRASASGYTAKSEPITSYDTTVNFELEAANCTATPSKTVNQTVTGSGPHKVTIETNSDAGINKGTIFRPTDIGPGKNYPIFLWGEGGCSQNGLSNKAAMGEIASWGYFVVADGTPGGGSVAKTSSSNMGDPKQFYGYLDWLFAQNKNPCSAYYQTLDTTKVAADGFSCGGLMSINASGDPRFTAMGYTSSGLFSADQNTWKKIHTPFKIMNGGSSDMAYENGLRDYEGISALGKPIIYFSKTSAGHGGDLNNAKGDFNTVNLAWLNWQLKGETGATGKGLLMGPDCKYCKASGWEFKVANIQ